MDLIKYQKIMKVNMIISVKDEEVGFQSRTNRTTSTGAN